jgi:hypothetical protein
MKHKKNKYKEIIDLKTAYPCVKLYSRLIWQKLFDVFRTNGGDISLMDNMLCDLYSLNRYFESGPFKVYWHFCSGYTVMQGFQEPNETNYVIEYNADNNVVTIEELSK